MDEINKIALSKIHKIVEETVKDLPDIEEKEEVLASGHVRINPEDIMFAEDVSPSEYVGRKYRTMKLIENLYPQLIRKTAKQMMDEGLVFKDPFKQLEVCQEIVNSQVRQLLRRFDS